MTNQETQINQHNSNSIIYKDNILYYHLFFINGNVFYALEYFEYLQDYFTLIIRVPSESFKEKIIKLWFEKYKKNIVKELLKKIIFIKDNDLTKKIKIISKKSLVLDGSSILDKDKIFFSKKCIYNYGDDEKSLKQPLGDNKIITIGDQEINCKVDYHYPLCLNFKLFKTLKEISPIENKTLLEIKDENIFDRNRQILNFHSTFNTLCYKKTGTFFERANRIIPECKFYNKKIIFEDSSIYQNDSAKLRYSRDYSDYFIYDFKNKDKSFIDFVLNI